MNLRLTRRALALSVVAFGAIAIGGTALAGHLADSVKSYTGCLVPKDGVIIKVKEGNAPASACTAGMTQVHLSGGDITKISVTGALTGGGDNGEVTIGLKPEFTLPAGCTSGQVAKWNGTGWACAADNDTTYSAGTGLDLSASPSNEFSIEPGYRIPGKLCSTAGQFVRGFNGEGEIQCSAPGTPAPEVWFRRTSRAEAPEGSENVVFEFFLLPGKYLAHVTGTAGTDDVGDDLDMGCSLRRDDANAGATRADGDVHAMPLAIATIVEFTATAKLSLVCTSVSGGNHVAQLTLVVMKVGTVN